MDRRKKVSEIILKNKFDAVLVSSVSNIIYLTGYSGFSHFEREAFLIISKNQNYIITDGRYSEAVSKIPNFNLLEISSENSLENIFKDLAKKIRIIGIEETDISLSEYKKLKKYFKIKPVPDLHNLRVLKDNNEITKIEQACGIGDEAFSYILGKLKTGVTEKQIAFELEMFIKKKGAELSFPSIVAFGKNSSMPHYKTNNEKLIANNIVLLDFGVKLENYCSDMTRTVFFGKADDKFKKIYNTVLTSQQKAIEFIKSSMVNGHWSISASKVDKVAREYITKQGFPTIPHSLGHGIGIEVHEAPSLSPKSKDILKPNMVFSIEPGIYIPNYGGVRIEDLVVLRESSLSAGALAKVDLLTHSPKNLLEI